MKRKRVRLSPQRTKLVKALARGNSMADAGKIAGYSCRQAASKALRTIRANMPEIMEKHGLTDDALVSNYLLPLMKAKQTKFFANNGIVTDQRDVSDNATRMAALDTALKLKGSYPKAAESDNRYTDVKLTIEYIGREPDTGPGGQPRLPGEPRTIENPAPPQNDPSRDDAIDVQPLGPTEEPNGSVEAVPKEPNPAPPTNQVVPPTVPVSPKTQVAGFVRLGRPRRFGPLAARSFVD